jgi:hypothetical protein
VKQPDNFERIMGIITLVDPPAAMIGQLRPSGISLRNR